jgi:hypothetical protein
MSDLHVIRWDAVRTGRTLWYAGTKEKNMRYKSMRTQVSPEIVIYRSALLSDAIQFDSFVDAYDVYNNSKIRRGGEAQILYLTEQQFFKKILEGA